MAICRTTRVSGRGVTCYFYRSEGIRLYEKGRCGGYARGCIEPIGDGHVPIKDNGRCKTRIGGKYTGAL